ncbi:hypothetical protein CMUS01_05354 [Colletotrichum musicola]|uniref:Uncharacterized protein n=1 Tax=Colletotrichum musicola TaxID=2175873 RepID=A0A8H6NL63_9PEZI|nr:hypothetical protein CMUS01_05354 [Colletotrichum musicola]
MLSVGATCDGSCAGCSAKPFVVRYLQTVGGSQDRDSQDPSETVADASWPQHRQSPESRRKDTAKILWYRDPKERDTVAWPAWVWVLGRSGAMGLSRTVGVESTVPLRVRIPLPGSPIRFLNRFLRLYLATLRRYHAAFPGLARLSPAAWGEVVMVSG